MGVMKRVAEMKMWGGYVPVAIERAFGTNLSLEPGPYAKDQPSRTPAEMEQLQLNFGDDLRSRIDPNHNPGGPPW